MMEKRLIRVSMDVSFAAGTVNKPAPVTGVGRVIKELFTHLIQFQDLDLKAVGCFGNDWNPVATSYLAERWANKIEPGGHCMPAYRSITGASRRLAAWQVKREGASGQHQSLARRAIRRVIRMDARPNIDHSNTDVFFATFAPPPQSLSESVPRVAIVYDMYPARFPELCGSTVCGNLEKLIESISPVRDVVVAISEFSKSDFCQLTGFPSDRVFVCHLAADTKFRPVVDPAESNRVREKYRLGQGPYLLSVANPQPRKNLVMAIKAFVLAAERLPEWDGVLVLAGNPNAGWGSASIQSAIADNPLIANRIVWLTDVSDDDLPVLYSGATAFLFPSTFEGFGLPVLEAMQCGTPVICSNATSLPEVGGNSVVYCDPMNVDEFTNAIIGVHEDPNKRKLLQDAGLAQATKFCWSKTADSVAQALRRCVDTIGASNTR
jgi:glycosyltransferase involved in cell wall biosynthesis